MSLIAAKLKLTIFQSFFSLSPNADIIADNLFLEKLISNTSNSVHSMNFIPHNGRKNTHKLNDNCKLNASMKSIKFSRSAMQLHRFLAHI